VSIQFGVHGSVHWYGSKYRCQCIMSRLSFAVCDGEVVSNW
jgi:hypothetical protein